MEVTDAKKRKLLPPICSDPDGIDENLNSPANRRGMNRLAHVEKVRQMHTWNINGYKFLTR